MKNTTKIGLLFLGFFLSYMACKKDEPKAPIVQDTTPFVLTYGDFPTPDLPTDNPLTIQGVQLGRMLFYEKMLSKDGTQACADCHRQPDGFSDSLQFSIGVEKMNGKRQAMPAFNMAWHAGEFFWDGRAKLLREQSLKPIQDALEMNETLPNAVAKLQATEMYRDQFMRTFGSEEVTSEKMGLVMEQFMLTIVSTESKYDKFLRGDVQLTDSEERGRALFFAEYNPFFPDVSGADCAHCHSNINFSNNQYMNNGLDTDAEITDKGREDVTMDAADRAKFKVPSLRNIALTAPYMHDGRFKTLEEVVDHYNEGIRESATAEQTVLNTKDTGLLLGAQDKADLIAFLHTLTDDVFVANEAYKTPF